MSYFFSGPILFLLLSPMLIQADLNGFWVFNLSNKSFSVHVFVICYSHENKLFLDPGNYILPQSFVWAKEDTISKLLPWQSSSISSFMKLIQKPKAVIFLVEVTTKFRLTKNWLQQLVPEAMHYLQAGDTVMTPLTSANNQISLLSVTHMH